jgi:hypothetical protein
MWCKFLSGMVLKVPGERLFFGRYFTRSKKFGRFLLELSHVWIHRKIIALHKVKVNQFTN